MNDADLQAWLEIFLRDHGGVAGTVHVRPPEGDLDLAAAVNIPTPVHVVGAPQKGCPDARCENRVQLSSWKHVGESVARKVCCPPETQSPSGDENPVTSLLRAGRD
jgi:hypothetical protein